MKRRLAPALAFVGVLGSSALLILGIVGVVVGYEDVAWVLVACAVVCAISCGAFAITVAIAGPDDEPLAFEEIEALNDPFSDEDFEDGSDLGRGVAGF